MRKSGGVVPQPHRVIVAEPVCIRMVQFKGKFVCFNPNTLRVLPMLKAFQFPQNSIRPGCFNRFNRFNRFNPNTPRVLPMLPRYRVTADLHFTTAYSNLQQEYKKV